MEKNDVLYYVPSYYLTLNTDTEIMEEFIFNYFSSEDLQQIKKPLHLQFFKKKIVKLPH